MVCCKKVYYLICFASGVLHVCVILFFVINFLHCVVLRCFLVSSVALVACQQYNREMGVL